MSKLNLEGYRCICSDCAKSKQAKWPDGFIALWVKITCPACKEKKICTLSENYQWPEEEDKIGVKIS